MYAFYRLESQKFLICYLSKGSAEYLFQNTQPSLLNSRLSFWSLKSILKTWSLKKFKKLGRVFVL